MVKKVLFVVFYLLLIDLFGANEGNGSSGSLVVSTGTTTINSILSAISGASSSGATTLNVGSTTGFAVNDAVLVMQMIGTNAGRYDELIISSLTTTSMTFTSPTTVAYSSTGSNRAQVIRIPQYVNITINSGATLTAPAWNGTTGGVLVFYSNGLVTNNGIISMTGKGFLGGAGGTGNAGGTAGTRGSGASSANGAGANASPTNGGEGGSSSAGKGGNGGIGNLASLPNSGTAGTGIGAGGAGVAGSNLSSGLTSLVMGGGGGGGQGGQGGQGGGAGGGGGAASAVGVITGTGRGSAGGNGSAGSASTGVGGTGGTGGGIIYASLRRLVGTGTVVANGNNGSNATGTGGAGGDGGDGGNGGAYLLGFLTNGGGGGGAGKGGQGGQGPGGGSAGGAGIIALQIGTNSFTGSITNNPGTGGTGGAGGASGDSGEGGNGGLGYLFGAPGSAGGDGGPVTSSLSGPSGASGTLGLGPIITLPITLLSFNGRVDGSSIILEWITGEELNNAFFIIERSEDGIEFKEVTSIPGQVISTIMQYYSITDFNPFIGVNYYRIKQVDIDGTETISSAIAVNYANNQISIYPNPVNSERVIYIHCLDGSLNNENKALHMYNSLGELVYENNSSDNSNVYSIQLPMELVPGVYQIEYKSNTSIYKNKIILN